MNIHVSNLSFDLQDQDLKKLFIPYGEVSTVKIVMDRATDRSRGFGFVEMSDDTAGRKAIAELDGVSVGGRPIKVSEAKQKQERKFDGPADINYNNAKSYNQTRY
jgi:RNA recognition motif-containing protein